MIKIRLARGGSKKRPFYRIVVATITSPRDGKFLEKIGTYNPLLAKDDENKVVLNVERFKYWISVGAQPTERITRFKKVQDIIGKPNIRMSTKKALTKKESA